MSIDLDVAQAEAIRMMKWIGYVDENYDYKAKYNSKFNTLECCSSYFQCCIENSNFFTPTSLLLHWNIKCKNDEVWNKLYYEEGDDDDPIPISELERKRFSRKARTKRIDAFHEVNHTKHRKSSRKSESEDDNSKIHNNTPKKTNKQYNNESDEDEVIITPQKPEIEEKIKVDNNTYSDSEDEDVKIEVIRKKIKSPSLSSEESTKKKRKYKTKKNEEEDEEDEYVEHFDNIYGDIDDDEEEGLEGLEMDDEEEEEDDDDDEKEEEYAIKRKSSSKSNIHRKSKKTKKQQFNYSDSSDKDNEYEYNEIKSNKQIKNENNHNHNHKKKKYFNQKKTIGEDKSEYKICTETIFDRKSLELYLLNHVIRAYVVEKLKESERKSKKRQTFTSILAE